jgi:hypothetical protein
MLSHLESQKSQLLRISVQISKKSLMIPQSTSEFLQKLRQTTVSYPQPTPEASTKVSITLPATSRGYRFALHARRMLLFLVLSMISRHSSGFADETSGSL